MKKVNTIFISPETLTHYFDVAWNKRNAGEGPVFCVWLFSSNGCQKTVSETKCYLSTMIERQT